MPATLRFKQGSKIMFVLLFTILTINTPPHLDGVESISGVFNSLASCKTAGNNHSAAIRAISPAAKITFTCAQS
jgi:hypothetical protein